MSSLRAPLAHELAIGRPLRWPIFDRYGKLLLKKGEVIRSEDLLRALLERGLIHDEDPRIQRERDLGPAQAARDEPPRSVFRTVRALGDRLELILIELHGERCGDAPAHCRDLARQLQAACARDLDAALAAFQVDACEAFGTTASRGIQVAVLTEMLGRALTLDSVEREVLICAAFTHDLGMHALSETFNRQKLALSPQQRDALHLHPEVSCERLRAAGVDDTAWLEAVRQHHERLDGSGYPHRLDGDAIGLGARMLAVIDSYTAMIRPRAYREAVQSREALRQLFVERGKGIDESMAAVFIRDIGVYPPGTFVRLQNGEVAVVTRRGVSAASPQLCAVVGASGTPILRPSPRDSRNADCAIVGALPTQRYRSVLARIHELWDEAPAAVAVA